MKKLKLNKDNYPWYEFYGDVPKHIDYPTGSMVEVGLLHDANPNMDISIRTNPLYFFFRLSII